MLNQIIWNLTKCYIIYDSARWTYRHVNWLIDQINYHLTVQKAQITKEDLVKLIQEVEKSIGHIGVVQKAIEGQSLGASGSLSDTQVHQQMIALDSYAGSPRRSDDVTPLQRRLEQI